MRRADARRDGEAPAEPAFLRGAEDAARREPRPPGASLIYKSETCTPNGGSDRRLPATVTSTGFGVRFTAISTFLFDVRFTIALTGASDGSIAGGGSVADMNTTD